MTNNKNHDIWKYKVSERQQRYNKWEHTKVKIHPPELMFKRNFENEHFYIKR